MGGIDFERYRFDFDLTFALLLMEPDGTILHTFAGRDFTDAESHLSIPSLVTTLRKTLVERAARPKRTAAPRGKGKRIEDLDAYKERLRRQKKKPECVHCHEVHDMWYEDAVAKKRWKLAQAWRWPDPRQIGLRMERDQQQRVAEVLADSPAARVGLQTGDVLTQVGGAHVLTYGDLQRALHDTSAKAGTLDVAWTRKSASHTGTLKLKRDWKEPTPLVFSWRSSKWPLPPQPGFGGRPLEGSEKRALGIPKEKFAFRIGYLVTWGPRARTGHNARSAGLRRGDIVTSLDGKDDFRDMNHYHAWFRLTRKPGSTVEVRTVRNGKPRTVQLPVLP